jgi:hypothetical protein
MDHEATLDIAHRTPIKKRRPEGSEGRSWQGQTLPRSVESSTELTTKTGRSVATFRADEGTRTLDLLHGKGGHVLRPFA